MLFEEVTIPQEALPIDAFKAHLRLGTGFGTEDIQEPVLVSFLRAAIAAIEARTGKALIARAFSWTVSRWRNAQAETLPIAPVQQITGIELIDAEGQATALAPERYALETDAMRPRLLARGAGFAPIAHGGKAVIGFAAGFGPTWEDVPDDLAQAVFLLAAHYYEYRDETNLARGCMPFGVQTLIERHRAIRLFGGGAA